MLLALCPYTGASSSSFLRVVHTPPEFIPARLYPCWAGILWDTCLARRQNVTHYAVWAAAQVDLTWLAHPEIDTRGALLTHGTYPRRLLVCTAVWAVGMTALAWCLALFASPCPVVSAVDAYNCDSPVTSTLRMVENLNFVGCFVVLLYFYLSKSVEASRMLREGQSAFDPSAVDKPATVRP